MARQKFTMTQDDYDKIISAIDAARETPMIMLQCGSPESPQEAANRAWAELGSRMGFDSTTVLPDHDGHKLDFTAIPTKVTENEIT